MIIFDKNGDVVLEVQGQSLQVSSNVLCLSSPVFAAMLQSSFKEGSQSGTLEDGRRIISLPDDDLNAVSLYCKVIHFHDVPLKPEPLILVALAMVCDKYSVFNAITGWANVWLRHLLTSDTSMEDLSSLMIFTYVLNLADAFSEACRRLLLTHAGSFRELAFSNHPLICSGLAGMLTASLI